MAVTVSRARIGAVLCIALALAVVACKEGRPPAREPETSSAWLRASGPPPARAAVGYLAGANQAGSAISVTWSADHREQSVASQALLAQPQPALIPVLAPLSCPAVFDVKHGRALVWGARGWGWVSLERGLEVRPFEALLQAAVEQSKRASEHPGKSGWSLHKDRLLVLAAQALRAEPSEQAREVARTSEHWNAQRAAFSGAAPDALEPAALEVRAGERVEPVVAVRELRGDWALVVLPEPGQLIVGDDGAGLLVKWQAEPAGWAKLTKPGPVAGSVLNLWTTRAFGIGGVDY